MRAHLNPNPNLRQARPRADESQMSEPAPAPATGSLAVFRALRRQVQAGTLSWWWVLGTVAGLLLTWLFVAALFVLGCIAVALVAVGIARDGANPELQVDDPRVVAVAASLGATTVVVVAVGTLWHRRRVARHRTRMQRWADTHGWAYTPSSSLLSSRWRAPGIHGGTRATDVLTRSTPRGEVTSITLGPGAGVGRASRHAMIATGPRWFPTLSVTPTTGLDRAG